MTAMTFSHDDIRERLVDYLYGELDGATRAAFQAHLTSCAACRDEVMGAQRARLVAREVVRRPLGDAVPERVRARAFEAARAAAAARAVAAPGQAKVATAAAAPAPGIDVGAGWFTRLRRRWTWTLPTFATVAAMAVFLLVRATIFREAKHPVSEETALQLARPAPALPTAPAEEKPEPTRNVQDVTEAAPAGAPAAKGGIAAPSSAEGQTGSAARSRPSPAATGGHLHRQPAGGLSSAGAPPAGGGAGLAPHAAPVRKAKQSAVPEDGAFDDLDRGAESEWGRLRARDQEAMKDEAFKEEARPPRGSGATERASSSAGEAAKALKKAAPDSAATAGKRDFAQPPPPPAAAQPPPAPVAAAPSTKSKAIPQMEVDRVEQSSAGSATPAAEPKPSKSAASAANEDKAPRAPAAAPARADERAMPAPDPVAAQVSRADGLMHARRWADAVAAYRELLRRYPAHPSAPLWRQRLAAAQASLAADTGQFAVPPPQR